MPEKVWQSQVLELSRTLGWRHFHTYRSKKSPSGFPDLVLVRERVVFAELKREGGKLSASQAEWQLALVNAGAEMYVWRPSDLEYMAGILATRKKAA